MRETIRNWNVWAIHGVGFGAALILALVLYFVVIKPRTDDTANVQAATASVQSSGGTPDKVEAKHREYDQTVKTAALTEKQWEASSNRYMPDLNLTGTNLLATYEGSLIRVPATWGRWVTAWYDAQKNDGVIRDPGTEFPVSGFAADPNVLSQLTSLQFPQGGSWSVSLTAKSFNQALAHLKRFNSMEMHGMPVIDNVQMTGETPEIHVTYNLAMYVIPRKEPPAEDAMLVSAGGTAQQGRGGPGGNRLPTPANLGGGGRRPNFGGGKAATPAPAAGAGGGGGQGAGAVQ